MSSEHDLDAPVTFEPVSRDDWEGSATKALRGKSLDSLDTVTTEGIVRSPLYTRDQHSMDADESGLPGAAPFTRGASASAGVLGWEIRQTHDASAAGCNEAVLRDLERGVTGISLASPPADADALGAVLDGVYLDLAPVHLAPGSSSAQRAALLAVAAAADVAPSALSGNLGADPLGAAFRSGEPVGDGAAVAVADEAAALAGTHGSTTIAVDGQPYADAGASDAQELACVLATGVEWLRLLTAAGLEVGAAAQQLEFTLTVGPDQFLATAKLRAARTTWARVLQVSGSSMADAPMAIHAVTSSAMMTQRDPWVNMLRTTTACFAAAVGGADAITVQPFDSAIGAVDELGMRIARNTQLILHEETNAAAVIDPAGGSWYVEDLTRAVAAEAWNRFQVIESSGGMVAALHDGSVAAAIDTTREQRLAALGTRRTSVTGVSEFPDIHEEALNTAPLAGADDGLFRWAAPFEALRDAADAARAAGSAPTVFLANLGPIAVHTARATFAKNLFEVGGIEALGNEGFDEPSAVAAAFSESGSQLACICSSDAVYAEQAAEVAAALAAAGAKRVFLAGAPGDSEGAWRAAGVETFIHLGCDVLTTLQQAHELLAAD